MKPTYLTTLLLLIPFVVLGQGKDSTGQTYRPEHIDTIKYKAFNWEYTPPSTSTSYGIMNGIKNPEFVLYGMPRKVLFISAPDSNHIVTIKLSPSMLHKVNDSTYTFKQN